MTTHTFYEFFSGAGMARAGLGVKWQCTFANEFDLKKSATYRSNWPAKPDPLKVEDVAKLKISDLPGIADLAWASFPCQDLSLAGAGAGLKGDRSGTFWPFWRLMQGLARDARAPKVIALENVVGTLHSHGGKDFAAICNALSGAGYHFGAIVIDAVHFLPQSRPRLFVVAVREDLSPNMPAITHAEPSAMWHPRALVTAQKALSAKLRERWLWWSLPATVSRTTRFADLVEDEPQGVDWHTAAETAALLRMMSDVNREKVAEARKTGLRMVGAIYKRTRKDEVGHKVQRAEIRFDDVAGCLRTPAGGSSRQVIMIVHGRSVRSRLISPRETARLMGLPDSYVLPTNYNEAYHLTGDGVAVPVVRHLARHVIEPLVAMPVPAARVAA